MKRIGFVGGCLLLCISLGLNALQYLRLRHEGTDTQQNPVDWSNGVRVKSIRETFLPAAGKITLHDIERQFCEGMGSQTLTVYPQLNTKQERVQGGLCRRSHQISWCGSLPVDFDLELKPGDEIHIQHPPMQMAPSYSNRKTDFRIDARPGILGFIPIPNLQIGSTLFSDEGANSDSSGSGTRVIEFDERERPLLQEWIETIRESADGFYISITNSPTSQPLGMRQWNWPVGSDKFKIKGGDHSIQLLMSEDSNVLRYHYDEE